MIEIRFDRTKDEVALLVWFLVDHSVHTLLSPRNYVVNWKMIMLGYMVMNFDKKV
jgi:hypothetical protein